VLVTKHYVVAWVFLTLVGWGGFAVGRMLRWLTT
jgi:hypothetical protein